MTRERPKTRRAHDVVGGDFSVPEPWRDRYVRCVVVACPTCGAEVGAACVRLGGGTTPTTHRARRRTALRKERES